MRYFERHFKNHILIILSKTEIFFIKLLTISKQQYTFHYVYVLKNQNKEIIMFRAKNNINDLTPDQLATRMLKANVDKALDSAHPQQAVTAFLNKNHFDLYHIPDIVVATFDALSADKKAVFIASMTEADEGISKLTAHAIPHAPDIATVKALVNKHNVYGLPDFLDHVGAFEGLPHDKEAAVIETAFDIFNRHPKTEHLQEMAKLCSKLLVATTNPDHISSLMREPVAAKINYDDQRQYDQYNLAKKGIGSIYSEASDAKKLAMEAGAIDNPKIGSELIRDMLQHTQNLDHVRKLAAHSHAPDYLLKPDYLSKEYSPEKEKAMIIGNIPHLVKKGSLYYEDIAQALTHAEDPKDIKMLTDSTWLNDYGCHHVIEEQKILENASPAKRIAFALAAVSNPSSKHMLLEAALAHVDDQETISAIIQHPKMEAGSLNRIMREASPAKANIIFSEFLNKPGNHIHLLGSYLEYADNANITKFLQQTTNLIQLFSNSVQKIMDHPDREAIKQPLCDAIIHGEVLDQKAISLAFAHSNAEKRTEYVNAIINRPVSTDTSQQYFNNKYIHVALEYADDTQKVHLQRKQQEAAALSQPHPPSTGVSIHQVQQLTRSNQK